MASGYIDSIKFRITSLENQVQDLQQHLQECENELQFGKNSVAGVPQEYHSRDQHAQRSNIKSTEEYHTQQHHAQQLQKACRPEESDEGCCLSEDADHQDNVDEISSLIKKS